MKKNKVTKAATGADFENIAEKKSGVGAQEVDSNPVSPTLKPALRAGFAVSGLTRTQNGEKNCLPLKADKEFIRSIIERVMPEVLFQPYQPAYVYNSETEWFVAFMYFDPKTNRYKRDKIRLGRKGLNFKQRQFFLERICGELNKMIEYRNKRGIYHQPERKQKNLMKLSLLEWADRLKDHEELSDNARANIRYFHHGFSNFIEKQPAFDITPEEIDKHFLKEFVKYLQSLGLAGRTINGNYLWAIKAITEQLVDLGYLDSVFETKNYHVKQVKNESGKYPPLSNDEMQLAFNYFREWKDGYFYLFMLHIYYTCIRPAELHRLKVDYFNFQERTIFVPWFKSKNGLSRYVQILEPLYNALIERGIDKLAPGTYIFGAECMPSTVQYTLGKYSSKIWHKKREAMGMPKEKQLYGLKHTFNSNYVNNNKANIDWEWLRRHNRHATKEQTQDYIADITAYFLDETTSYIPDYHTGNNT